MIKHLLGLVLALQIGRPVTSHAQSLADVARKEQERRTRVVKPAPIYTNKDLASGPASDQRDTNGSSPTEAGARDTDATKAVNQPSSDTVTEPGAASARGKLPKAREKRDERYWRERAAVLQERIARLRADTAALQARVTRLRNDAASAPADQAAGLTSELRLATGELVRFQTELRLIEQEWTTFEQRARDANVPPHWLQR